MESPPNESAWQIDGRPGTRATEWRCHTINQEGEKIAPRASSDFARNWAEARVGRYEKAEVAWETQSHYNRDCDDITTALLSFKVKKSGVFIWSTLFTVAIKINLTHAPLLSVTAREEKFSVTVHADCVRWMRFLWIQSLIHFHALSQNGECEINQLPGTNSRVDLWRHLIYFLLTPSDLSHVESLFLASWIQWTKIVEKEGR
jgi:hypothetical protein